MKKKSNYNWEKFLNNDIKNIGKNTDKSAEIKQAQTSFNSSHDSYDHTEIPNMYKVYLVNDEETPDEFICFILKNFFHIDESEILKIKPIIEKEIEIFCGIYSKEVAESKVVEVVECSRSNKFSLKCIMRKDQEYASKKS